MKFLFPSLLLVISVCGCQAPRAGTPLTQHLGASDPDTQLEFWHRLNERSMTTDDDAFHGVLLYVDGKDDCADYPARVSQLKSRKMLPTDFNRPADEAVQRGTLAVAIVRILQIRGGLMMNLIGPTPRYAVRELVYRGIYPESSPNQTFSGAEFVGIIGRVEDEQRGDSTDKPATEMPQESANVSQ